MIGKAKVIKPGFFSTIQDEGRFGFSEFGVPKSGAMDKSSFRFANSLLGNDQNDACIEWVFQSPVLEFNEPTMISLTGAFSDCFLNGNSVEMYQRIEVLKGDVLAVDFCKKNKYGYVGIKNGFLTPTLLNSRSFFKAITPQYLLNKNDKIDYQITKHFSTSFSSISTVSYLKDMNELFVYKGAEFGLLSHKQKRTLLNSEFTVSGVANRMAIQLKEQLSNNLPSMLTSPVLPGTIQLTPSGNLIVLMRDCQTTGGYPRVLQLNEQAVDHIAQKRTGEKLMFRLITDF